MCKNIGAFFLVPDCFKTQEMYNDGVEVDPWQMNDVPDYLNPLFTTTRYLRETSKKWLFLMNIQ